ncbi:MAG: hypothetical protein Q8O98_02135 [bacterium]|nr:hypothetical protein [bacterium]
MTINKPIARALARKVIPELFAPTSWRLELDALGLSEGRRCLLAGERVTHLPLRPKRFIKLVASEMSSSLVEEIITMYLLEAVNNGECFYTEIEFKGRGVKILAKWRVIYDLPVKVAAVDTHMPIMNI